MTATKTQYPGIYKRVTASGATRYDVVFREPGEEKQKARTFKTKKEARDWQRDNDSAMRRGEPVIDIRDKTTVADYARVWIGAKVLRPSSREHQESIVRVWLDGTELGRTRLSRVRKEDVDRWVRHWLVEVARKRSTVAERAGFVSSVLAYAVENGRLRRAPKVELLKADRSASRARDVHPVGRADAVRLAEAIGTPTEAVMVRLQQGAGLRRSELLGLLATDVDLDARVLRVTGQALPDGTRVGYAKTHDSLREVPLRDGLVALLQEHLSGGTVLPPGDGRLFLNPRTGKPWTAYTWGYRFGLAVKVTAGVHPATTSHDLRHGFAVELRRAGLDADAVGHLMGHSNGRQVLETYNGFLPDQDALTREAMDRAWGSSDQSK